MQIHSQLPYFLQSIDKLNMHFQEQFEGESSNVRGDKFADFVRRLVPSTEFGKLFDLPISRKKSHDDGIDFIASGEDKNTLCIQSKYTIKGKEEFDSIISKFKNYYSDQIDNKYPLFKSMGVSLEGESPIFFQIITLHNLENIIQRYENSNLSSREFYNQLVASGRLEIVDVRKILRILSDAYIKSYIPPQEFTLKFVTPILTWDNVFIGVISGLALKDLYSQYGEALFFENIRDYLGTINSPVNVEIIETANQSPELFLARNNGIVLKASEVDNLDGTSLRLYEPSIVNGCQTTICLVGNIIDQESYVLVKVVKTKQAWDVAKTANRQNQVGKLELEIAQFLRPQRIKKAAVKRGFSIEVIQTYQKVSQGYNPQQPSRGNTHESNTNECNGRTV